MHIYIANRSYSTRIANDQRTYYLTVQRWDPIRYLTFKCYHWWHMRLPRLDRLHVCLQSKGYEIYPKGRVRLRDRIRSLPFHQDERCYQFSQGFEDFVTVVIDQDTYERLKAL